MKNYKLYFLVLIIFSIIARFFAILYFGDTEIEYEWRLILSNLEKYNTLGYRIHNGEVIPNIFMPPLYPIFLYLLKLISPSYFNFVNFVLYSQLMLSIISIYFFGKILDLFYERKISMVGNAIFSFFPLNVYSISQVTSVSLQVFLLVIFFYYFILFVKKQKDLYLIIFSIFSGLIILLRGEFLLFYFFTLGYTFYLKRNLRKLFLSLILVVVFLSPYVVRNYKIFNEITITKSFGYNLWKGNNNYIEGFNLRGIEGSDKFDDDINYELSKLKKTKYYDLNRDLIFKNLAINNIKSEPSKYTKLYFKKLFGFLLVGKSEKKVNNHPLYVIPKLTLSVFTLFGIFYLFKDRKKLLNYFSLYYLGSIAFFSIFFILPRYTLMILPIQIILSCYLIKRFNKF